MSLTNWTTPSFNKTYKPETQVVASTMYDFMFMHWPHVLSTPYLRAGLGLSYVQDLHRKYNSLGILTKGVEHPDWRFYCAFDNTQYFFMEKAVQSSWLNGFDVGLVTHLFDSISPTLPQDPNGCLALLRDFVNEDLDTAHQIEFIALMLLTKHKLMSSEPDVHDALSPVYNSIYPVIVRRPSFWSSMLERSASWRVITSFHLFPYDFSLVDIEGFSDVRSWFAANYTFIHSEPIGKK